MLDFSPFDMSDSANNAVKNLTDPTTKTIGKTISDAAYLKFGPSSYKADLQRLLEEYGLREFERRLQLSIKYIPTEKLISPDFQTVMLAMDNLEPCLNSEDLRNLFANLLAKACHADYKDLLHPSFSEILRQMSPFDAKVLKFFVDTKPKQIISYTHFNEQSHAHYTVIPYLFEEYPESERYTQVSLSISSLLRLGILGFEEDALVYPIDDSPFMHSSFYQKCEKERIKDSTYNHSQVEGKRCIATPFGSAFISVCFS